MERASNLHITQRKHTNGVFFHLAHVRENAHFLSRSSPAMPNDHVPP